MLQSVSVDGISPPATPRPGSPRPDNRHSAQAKRQKYFSRLLKFRQMDFEFALWQMIYLMSAPQKVYRNFQYRKQTKNQWARDDPAFLVLLSICLCASVQKVEITLHCTGSIITTNEDAFILQEHLAPDLFATILDQIKPFDTRNIFPDVSSLGFAIVLGLTFSEFCYFLTRSIFIDCIGSGIIIATALWFVANHYLQGNSGHPQDVEWGFAFDIHLNAFFPVLILLHVVQLILYIPFLHSERYHAVFLSDTIWLIAIGYYVYITFLGYSALPFLKRTIVLLYPPSIVLIILYVLLLISKVNLSHVIMARYMKGI